ncbi:stage II sporulation protein M [Caloramator sp. CAR-1]|uniref:stage II sporulation protein M n=1 Tax=Caloramator sp. CAR-1 TaxID=3062777 RepID=UPI00237E8D64|nr:MULTISPECIES: stage II sporulation protein M [unclassified Caloramator]MDO6354516.1 stage II sporulation protein M [Caloramator sp. CAR-1]WDU84508.1 stage II sporulation protein M [Caloramator sp. Dgby_cultured_2]
MYTNIKDNLWIYFIITLMFTFGIALGALSAKGINYTEKQELVMYLNNFFQVINKENTNSFIIFLKLLKNNFIIIFILWILSLTYLGLIFSNLVSLFKGFIIGFNVAFILQAFGMKGFLFILLSFLPQNLFYIPAYLFICSFSFAYSLNLIKKQSSFRNQNDVIGYSFNILALFFIIFIGNILESFVITKIIKALSTYLVIQ